MPSENPVQVISVVKFMLEANVEIDDTGTVASCINSHPVSVSYTIKVYVTPGIKPVNK